MRRRLALAILLTVWTMLLVGGIAVYVGVRALLVEDFDSLLTARASALPELMHPAGFDASRVPVYDWHDRYVIQSLPPQPAVTQSLARMEMPRFVSARFTSDSEGHRWRSVSVSALASGSDRPILVEYSGRTDRIDELLNKIAIALAGFGIAGGVAAAGVALFVSHLVLRPLASTALWLGEIDEKNLDARVSLSHLPPELLPVSDRLNKMLSKLQKAFEDHKQFLAMASHELRVPVSAMEKSLAGGEADGVPSDQVLNDCRQQVRVLRSLVDSLSEYISDAGQAAYPVALVDVVALMRDCAATASTLGSAKQIAIKQSGPARLHCLLSASRLRIIVGNLLANAVEYGRPGGTVDLSYFHDGRDLHIRISDDGQGVASEHLGHLFEPFYRAGKTIGDESGHLGLGLFIVQTHLKSLKGSARVDSRTGQGTSVDVEFPCEVRVAVASEQAAVT